MKRGIITILQAIFICLMGNAQYIENSMTVKSMNGKSRPLSSYIDQTEGQVTLFVFWKTCCPTNLNMIDSLLELTDENGFSNDIKVILVSVDDNRSTDRVMPVVKTKGWEADVILDVNMELARAMSVYIPPQWVAVDHNGSPIFRRKIMEGESDAEYYFNELINNDSVNLEVAQPRLSR